MKCLKAAGLLSSPPFRACSAQPSRQGNTAGERAALLATATTGPYAGPAVTFHGTVKAITKKEIVLDLDEAEHSEERSLTLRRSGKTRFFDKDEEVKATDIPAGTPVTLDATRDGDMKLSALRGVVSRPPSKSLNRVDNSLLCPQLRTNSCCL